MTLKYKVSYEPNVTTFRLTGPINEHVADVLEDLRPQAKSPKVVFDVEHLSYINSIGAATWMAHLKAFEDLEVTFVKCPSVFTSLCLMMPDLAGEGRIESLFVRYYCPTCEEELNDQLIQRAEISTGAFPSRTCPNTKCKAVMAVDPEDEDFCELLHQQKTA